MTSWPTIAPTGVPAFLAGLALLAIQNSVCNACCYENAQYYEEKEDRFHQELIGYRLFEKTSLFLKLLCLFIVYSFLVAMVGVDECNKI